MSQPQPKSKKRWRSRESASSLCGRPIKAARQILADAFGIKPREQFDREAPADLVPGWGRYPTERVQYDVLVLHNLGADPVNLKVAGEHNEALGPNRLETAGQLDWSKSPVRQWASPDRLPERC